MEDKIFNFSQNDTTEIKRTIFVEHEELSNDELFEKHYSGFVEYENLSKKDIKDLLNANNNDECWTIFANKEQILTEENQESEIEQWLNEQPEQKLNPTKKSKRRM